MDFISASKHLCRFYLANVLYFLPWIPGRENVQKIKKERSFAPIFVEHPSSWWFPSNPKAKKRSLFRGRIRSYCRLKLRHPDGFVEASICSAMVHGSSSSPGEGSFRSKGSFRSIESLWSMNHILRKSKPTKLCQMLGSGILNPWIILKTSHFVWSDGLPGYTCRHVWMFQMMELSFEFETAKIDFVQKSSEILLCIPQNTWCSFQFVSVNCQLGCKICLSSEFSFSL